MFMDVNGSNSITPPLTGEKQKYDSMDVLQSVVIPLTSET